MSATHSTKVAPVAAVAVVLGVASAAAATTPVAAHITPKVAGPTSSITISFKTPIKTGIVGKTVTFLEIQGSNTNTATFEKRSCLSSLQVDPPYGSAAGAEVSASVRPSTKWCAGTYRMQVLELKAPICFVQRTCPTTTLNEFGFFELTGKFKVT